MLSGLEPHVTGRVLDMPALSELRKAVAERLRTEQVTGTVRPDIDPVVVGSGVVVIVISLLTSILQFGNEGIDVYGQDVIAVFSRGSSTPSRAARPPSDGPTGRPSRRVPDDRHPRRRHDVTFSSGLCQS